jgi:hypothetical protein
MDRSRTNIQGYEDHPWFCGKLGLDDHSSNTMHKVASLPVVCSKPKINGENAKLTT